MKRESSGVGTKGERVQEERDTERRMASGQMLQWVVAPTSNAQLSRIPAIPSNVFNIGIPSKETSECSEHEEMISEVMYDITLHDQPDLAHSAYDRNVC